jgi:hypothetical protein
MKLDELTGMYTAEMIPEAGPKVLSKSKAAFQRAVARAATTVPTPLNSEDEDWSWMTEDQRRKAETAKRILAQGTQEKAAAPPRTPADQPTGAKAPTPTKGQAKGQESPETEVSHPMETGKRTASRAGGSGSGGGSGKTDTSVSRGNPSKT